MNTDEMIHIMTGRINFLEGRIDGINTECVATKSYINECICDLRNEISYSSRESIDIELIISEAESRFREVMKERYEKIKSDRCSLGMTNEEFEYELERLLFES